MGRRQSRHKVLVIRRHKRQRTDGKLKGKKPELIKNPELSVFLKIRHIFKEMVER